MTLAEIATECAVIMRRLGYDPPNLGEECLPAYEKLLTALRDIERRLTDEGIKP